jgi:hypothetical protein
VSCCAQMWLFARRVTTKVTTVRGDIDWSEAVKPKIRLVPITQLVLDEKNSNSGTKRGRELLDGSLEKYGAGIPEPKWTCPVSALIRHRATACVKTCS